MVSDVYSVWSDLIEAICQLFLAALFLSFTYPGSSMKTITGIGNEFKEAAGDYLYLLERRYPQGSIIKMIGDRYRLNSVERSVLYRGISARKDAERRSARLLDTACLADRELHIDGFNVLITIGSYLNGNLVFISNDNIMRDASEIHSKVIHSQLIDKAILLLFSAIESIKPAGLFFYLDEPVSHSGEICHKIKELIDHYHYPGSASTFKSPDFQLKSLESGVAATSDTGIIDNCKVPVADLPKFVLSYHFRKEFLDIRNFISDDLPGFE